MSTLLETIVIPLVAGLGGGIISGFAPRWFKHKERIQNRMNYFYEHLRIANETITNNIGISRRDFYVKTKHSIGHSAYAYFLNTKMKKNDKLYNIKKIACEYSTLRKEYKDDDSILTKKDGVRMRDLYIDLEKILNEINV